MFQGQFNKLLAVLQSLRYLSFSREIKAWKVAGRRPPGEFLRSLRNPANETYVEFHHVQEHSTRNSSKRVSHA